MSTPRHRPDDREVAALSTAECWRLLEDSHVGRLAVTRPDGTPDVFPLNYVAHQGKLYLRSGPGRKLRSVLANPAVALEVDGEDNGAHWSVVVHGAATQVEATSEILESGARHLISDHPDSKPHVIRITPDSVTGRRFPQRAAHHGEAEAPSHGVRPADAPGKPKPIPHFPPPWQR